MLEQITFRTEELSESESDQRLKITSEVIKEAGTFTDSNHRHFLTPDRLILNGAARRQFDQIGELILAGFAATESIFARARAGEYPSDLNRFIVNALEAGIRKSDKKTLGKREGDLPLFYRADCILAITLNGLSLMMTEIEGERAIGFGFATIDQRVHRALNDSTIYDSGLGVGNGIARAISNSRYNNQDLSLILGEDQLFYLPEQNVLVEELRENGVPVSLVKEGEITVTGGSGIKLVSPSGREVNAAVSLPVFNPDKSKKHLEIELLRLGYVSGEFGFLLPPKKFFGTKSALALMRQPFIQELYQKEGLDPKIIDTYIPRSRIIAGQISEIERLTLEMGQQTIPPTLIKAVGMSAGRGMMMPDNMEGIRDLLSRVTPKSPFEYLTQEFLESQAVNFRIYDQSEDRLETKPYCMRLVACFANIDMKPQLLVVAGTGLDNTFVHGNPKCIQFPVVFE